MLDRVHPERFHVGILFEVPFFIEEAGFTDGLNVRLRYLRHAFVIP